MAATDNKVLTGAGVEQLSQLVKNAIAQGGGTEYTAGYGIEINSTTNEISGPNYGVGGVRREGYSLDNIPTIKATSGTDFVTKIKTGKVVLTETSDGIRNLTTQLGLNELWVVNVSTNGQDSVGTWFYLTRARYYILSGMVIYFADTLQSLFSYLHRLQHFNSSSLSASTLGGAIDELATKIPTLATTETPGTVIPDGTTITIDSNGVISSQGGGGSSYTFTNGLTESDGTVSWDLNNAIQPGSTYNNNIHIGKIYSGANGITGAGAIGIGWHAYATGQEAIAHATDGNTVSGLGAIGLGNCNVYARDALGFGPNSSIGRAGMSQTGNTGTVLLGHSNIVDSTYAAKDFGLGAGLTVSSDIQLVLGFKNVEDANSQFSVIIGNGDAMHSIKRNGMAFAKDNSAIYASGNLYVGCTDYTTTSSGPTTTNCGGQKVFYGTLTSTDTAPTVEGAINWVYE